MTRSAVLLSALAAAAATAVALVVLLRPGAASVRPKAHAALPADVRVASTRLGRVLVDRQGHTLYLFVADRHGRSRCAGACARVWPPAVITGARARAGAGIVAAKLGTTTRRDGTRQLVYARHPLYTMTADTRPGQIEGQGFLRTWYVVSPAGRLIVGPGAPRPSRTGGGY